MDQPAAMASDRIAWGRCLFTLVFLTLVTAGALRYVQPPSRDPVGCDFSTDAAMDHLKVIAREPRPIGSQANSIVREYLVRQFSDLGFEVEEQEAMYLNEAGIAAWRITNVLARHRGTGDGTAVILMAHFDSVPVAPGAGDDGAAVAALLEVARVLKSGPRMRNDIVLLFTDGEEYGLMGARAFVRDHAWFKDIGLALNFEGRGSSGPSIMFQTSPGNAWLIEQFAEAAVQPVTSSLAYEVFRLMSTSSDFVPFRNADVAGFDFVFLGSPQNYHSKEDNLANLDPRSLRHHGVQALSLAKHFGNLNLRNLPRRDDVVFFSLPWLGVVYYSEGWALALALFAVAAHVASILCGLKRRRLRLRRIAIAFAAGLLNAVIVSGATFLVWQLLPSTDVWHHPDLTFLGFVFFAIAITLALVSLSFGRLDAVDTAVGVLTWWSLLGVASAVWLPAASYIFAWPLMFSSASLISLMYVRDPLRLSVLPLVVQSLCAVPGIVLITPTAAQACAAIGLQEGYVLSLVIVLLLWTLIPQLRTLVAPSRWILPIFATLITAVCLTIAAWPTA